MTKFIALFCKILITLPVIAILFFLTLSNKDQQLSLTWSPLSGPVSLSLPVILFLAIVAGFVWGALIMWSNTLGLREERRALKKKTAQLEKELELARSERDRIAKERPLHAPTATNAVSAPLLGVPEIH